jgi:nonsense-mediated mRNA decay protein 3
MSRSGAFCPRCGDPIQHEEPEQGPDHPEGSAGTRGPLCDACYFEEFDLVDAPDRVEVRVCARCGAVHRGNRWVDVGAQDYPDVAVEEVSEAVGVHVGADEVNWSVAPEQVDETTVNVHASFTGVVRGTPVTEETAVPVKFSRETCTRCGKIAGGSYAAVVQVRAADRTPTDGELATAGEIADTYVADREAAGDREAYLTEVKHVPDGLDMKLSTNKLGQGVAKRIVARLGGTVTDNETLVTEDEEGNPVYRVTYAVRLPTYRPGEIIDPQDGDGPVLVRSARDTLTGTRLASGESYEASFEAGAAPQARRLGTREDAQETTLVAVEDEHAVQVLDPETYEARTVARPAFLDPDAERVVVFKSRVGLFVLPREGEERGDGEGEEWGDGDETEL